MKPPAERGSQNLQDQAERDRVATSAQFQDLLARERAFIIPAFLFFLVYSSFFPFSSGTRPS
jgi:uncharacterized membrane protein (DUF485 family)